MTDDDEVKDAVLHGLLEVAALCKQAAIAVSGAEWPMATWLLGKVTSEIMTLTDKIAQHTDKEPMQ